MLLGIFRQLISYALLLYLLLGASVSATTCISGFASSFPCKNVNLVRRLPSSVFGTGSVNDLWGWTDPVSGTDYALLGLSNGVAFIDLSDPNNPVYIGIMPTQTVSSSWRDVKTFKNHAFVVSEALNHGVQIMNLNRLSQITSPPVIFGANAVYNGITSAHNIVINEASGRAYAVGSTTCSGGLHAIDINNPTSPTFLGCYAGDGYTHDAQCVTYSGPDTAYQGREICVALNEDTVTIVDMTNAQSPVLLSRTGYPGADYTHQGWFTDDHSYFLMNDEGDEHTFGHNTRTYVWDLRDLDKPVLTGFHQHTTAAIDHNLYVVADKVYEANYRSGLRVLQLGNLNNAQLTEVAYFDTQPQADSAVHSGAWSVYPFFDSNVVIVSDTTEGLFVLQPDLIDSDGDGIGNIADSDDDDDGVLDVDDAFPLDPDESLDTDNDGMGNNADSDDDGDEIPDEFESANGLDPLDAGDANLDNDGDGLTNLEEFQLGRNPNVNEAAVIQIINSILLDD